MHDAFLGVKPGLDVLHGEYGPGCGRSAQRDLREPGRSVPRALVPGGHQSRMLVSATIGIGFGGERSRVVAGILVGELKPTEFHPFVHTPHENADRRAAGRSTKALCYGRRAGVPSFFASRERMFRNQRQQEFRSCSEPRVELG